MSAARVRTPSVVTITAGARESVDGVFARLATAIRAQDATVAALFVYGDVAARQVMQSAMRRYLGAIDWPVLWVEGGSCNGALVAGVQAFLLRGVEVERLLVKGRVVATVFSSGGARHCLLGGVSPDDPHAPAEVQARQTFENLRFTLAEAGFEFTDVARTWFFNDKLLDWYSGFNAVRTSFYANRQFRSGAVPASTGVDGRSPDGAALTAAAWAVQPSAPEAFVREVTSPLQCAARQYGSAFSRAVEFGSADERRLLISGTASIAPGGQSLWLGDVAKQVATTMDVVKAIFESRAMQWRDVVRATAYFKYPLDTAAFETWQSEHEVFLPAVYVHCDICRDDLLFEIELDACR